MSEITSSEPLVTVNILSYNRKDDLRVTLTKVFEQDYKNIEVIVVDNASIDGTVDMVEKEFPDVRLIKLQKNIGIAGWNEGFKTAKGEFILVLDDDSYPELKTIKKGVSEFCNNERLGIIAYNIYNQRYQKSETSHLTDIALVFVGCGSLIRKEVIHSVGYFNPDYFIYCHELDYSARCIDRDYYIKYLSQATIVHIQRLNSFVQHSITSVQSGFRYYQYFRGHSIFLIQHFNLSYTLLFLLKYIINRIIVGIRYGYLKYFLKGMIFILVNFYSIRKRGIVLQYRVQKLYKFGNVPFIDREYFPGWEK